MREIKFRAWSIQHKCICEVRYIDFETEQIGVEVRGKPTLLPLDEFELMQYTGLKDKQGKEIYEGDILWNCEYDEDHCIGEVYYDVDENTHSGFLIRTPIKNSLPEVNCFEDFGCEMEVIGNIHENPELMKE